MKIPDTIKAKVLEFREKFPDKANGIKAGTYVNMTTFLEQALEEVLAEDRERVRGIIDWELTPHGYESDDKYMEHFACELKEKYKNKILSSLDTLTDKE